MTPKGYWIAHITVTDPEAYKDYQEANAVPFLKYGARFLARGGKAHVMEGEAKDRHVIIVFPSLEAAHDCYMSPEYQAAKAKRVDASEGDVVIVEGYEEE